MRGRALFRSREAQSYESLFRSRRPLKLVNLHPGSGRTLTYYIMLSVSLSVGGEDVPNPIRET